MPELNLLLLAVLWQPQQVLNPLAFTNVYELVDWAKDNVVRADHVQQAIHAEVDAARGKVVVNLPGASNTDAIV